MSVEFEEENNFSVGATTSSPQMQQYQEYTAGTQTTGIIGFLIRKGIAANETTANAILLMISIACLGLTGFIIFKFII